MTVGGGESPVASAAECESERVGQQPGSDGELSDGKAIVSVLNIFDSIVILGHLNGRLTLCDTRGAAAGPRDLEVPSFMHEGADIEARFAPGCGLLGTVDRVPATTPPDDLRRRYMDASNATGCRPVIVEGGAAEWPALAWTFDSLCDRHGGVSVDVTFAGGKRRAMPLREYIGRFRGPAAQPVGAAGYLRGWAFERDCPALSADFTPPPWATDLFDKLPAAARPPFHWMFVGPAGASTPCHVDPLLTHAWLAQINGRKRFVLHPPAALKRVLLPGGGVMPSPAGGLEACLSPGDILFVPRFWAHEVTCLDDSISLTFNYLPLEYWPIVRTAFLCNRLGRAQAAVAATGGRDSDDDDSGAGGGGGPSRTVLCTDAVAWLLAVPDATLPCVMTSLPDITELTPPITWPGEDRRGPARGGGSPPAGEYAAWLSRVSKLVVSKLRPGACAVFYQTDALVVGGHGEYVDKSHWISAGAHAAGGRALWHKIALRNPAGIVRTTPGYTHVMAFAGPGGLTPGGAGPGRWGPSALPDVFPRGHVFWAKGLGAEAGLRVIAWMRDALGATDVVDPFCGSGAVLACARRLGLDATGVDLSPKRCRHAAVLELIPAERLRRSDGADGADGARVATGTEPGPADGLVFALSTDARLPRSDGVPIGSAAGSTTPPGPPPRIAAPPISEDVAPEPGVGIASAS